MKDLAEGRAGPRVRPRVCFTAVRSRYTSRSVGRAFDERTTPRPYREIKCVRVSLVEEQQCLFRERDATRPGTHHLSWARPWPPVRRDMEAPGLRVGSFLGRPHGRTVAV